MANTETTKTRPSWKTTMATTQRVNQSFVSKSLTPTYYYNTSSSHQASTLPITNDAPTLTSQSYNSTVLETTVNVEPTRQPLQTTPNAESPNKEKQQSGNTATIIPVVVAFILVLFMAAVILYVHRRRRKEQERHFDYHGKQPGVSAYSNATFAANDVDTDQPDIIGDLDIRNGLGPPDPSSSLADYGGSNLQEEGYIGYGAESPSAVEHGELKQRDRSTQNDRNCVSEELEYSVLEDPRDKDSQQCSKEPRVAEEQAYDHLNRDNDNTNGHQEQLHDNTYGAAAFLSDIDHYDTLVHSCEAELNQRKRQDITNLRNTDTKGAQDFENEYHTLSPVDEKKSNLLDNIDENTYNVLGETVDNLHRDGISPKTSENDNTTRDDYHILHSGNELGDYHEYQCLDQPLFSGSTANAVSQAKENEGRRNDYFLGRGDRGTNAQQRAESSSRYAEEHTYDHLNRDLCDVTMVDEPGKGQLTETSSKCKQERGDDYYSVVNVQGHVGTEYEQHEPLYSNDVYSELA